MADGAQERGLPLYPQALPPGNAGAHPGGKDSHSLVYSQDASFRRWLRVLKNHLGNMKRFRTYNKRPAD